MTFCVLRWGWGKLKLKTFLGDFGFSSFGIFSSCFTRLCTWAAFEATERNSSMKTWMRSISFCWFL